MMVRRTRFWIAGALVLAAGTVPAAAQQAPVTMTLEEALDLARRNNPAYRQAANDEGQADWAAREAYAQLLPSVTASNTFSYQASGTPRVGNLSAAEFGLGRTPVYYTSSYNLNMSMQLSGATFFRMAQQKANARAVEARVDAAEYVMASAVTQAYLAALRARDGVTIAQSALESADEAFKLAEARASVGAATKLDVTQAQVDRGRAEVGLLQAENLYDTERLRLLQTIGVTVDREVQLTSEFTVFEPTWTLDDLTATALESHPQLVSARRAESAAFAASKAAWSTYLPSLSLFGNFSGFIRKAGDTQFLITQAKNSAANRIASCEQLNAISAGLSNPLPNRPSNCTAEYAFTAADEAAIIADNNKFPFNYTGTPAYFQAQVSIPIFDGFTREQQLQTARVAADDARHQRRAEELARRTEVATAMLNLNTAYRTVQIEERNAAGAAEQLEIARERYRLGAGCGASGVAAQSGGLCTTFLELTRAQEQKVRADQAHLAAVYMFHETLATLEAAVGRSLR